jgi:hypothetical protein
MNSVSKPRGVLGVAKRDIPAVLARAVAMYNAMSANVSMFASPTIALSTFLALITACSLAQQNATETRARGTATLRNMKRDSLWTAMESLQKYAQGLADQLPAEGAVNLLQSAGLVVAQSTAHHKALLKAALTMTPGVIALSANASLLVGKADAHKKVMYGWQMSGDGGHTWSNMPTTTYASTEISGLTLLSTYSFRVNVTIGRTTGPWSDPVSILVH